MPNAFNQPDILNLIKRKLRAEKTAVLTPLTLTDTKKRRFLPTRTNQKVLKWLIRPEE
ncbi:MAG: hypothetical protein AAF798_09775 [Bacteroidota bacterium]